MERKSGFELSQRGDLCAAVLLTGAVAWLYGDVMVGLVRQWATDDDYSHGFFVIPLAAYFVWERRQALRAAAVRPNALGLLLLTLSLLGYLAGQLGSELFLTRASLVGVLAGLVLFLWGGPAFKLLLFPLSFLLLMVPLPAILFNFIAFPLQTLAARLGETVIALSGVPVLREGNILMVPGRALEVAEACSGIRSLMSLLMLAVVLGYFGGHRTGTRLLLALAAIPIAVVVNAARVAGTGLATYWISPSAADGFFHTFSGWLMFGIATGALLACQRALEVTRGHLFGAREVAC
jgi:exosortase